MSRLRFYMKKMLIRCRRTSTHKNASVLCNPKFRFDRGYSRNNDINTWRTVVLIAISKVPNFK